MFKLFSARSEFQTKDASPAATASSPSRLVRRPERIAGQDVCLFSIYAPGGKISRATAAYMESLAENGFNVIACVALDNPEGEFDLESLASAAGVAVHKNGGMDFAAWAGALRLLPDCWSASRLVFANDSVLMLPNLMGPFFERLRLETADFVGITDSLEIVPHVQTYLFQFQGAALSNPKLQEFWASVQVFKDKQDIIKTYEIKLLQHVTENCGLTSSVMFSLKKVLPLAYADDCKSFNITHAYWDHLVSLGMPFVKVELLRDNPLQMHILHWRSVFRAYGASVEIAEEHMQIRKGISTSSSAMMPQDRSELRMILKDINRVRLNSRRRRQARSVADADKI
ncbi:MULTISPECIES: rhamnan synthesis F family protein [unclassified Yoonia]|uniref:rhamnan synthesis F family protein n=1 Tax=unclassified Yoonia TaxID=2629118 RepID=UPI002AFE27F2|nr:MULTISPECIES: rhamnan synthesis F family protein [unclassified Yoonia]